jgi:hypothetical protein
VRYLNLSNCARDGVVDNGPSPLTHVHLDSAHPLSSISSILSPSTSCREVVIAAGAGAVWNVEEAPAARTPVAEALRPVARCLEAAEVVVVVLSYPEKWAGMSPVWHLRHHHLGFPGQHLFMSCQHLRRRPTRCHRSSPRCRRGPVDSFLQITIPTPGCYAPASRLRDKRLI